MQTTHTKGGYNRCIRFFYDKKKGCVERMDRREKRKARYAAPTLATLAILAGMGLCRLGNAGIEENEIKAQESSAFSGTDTVLAGGMPAGIYMETNGVLVLSTERMKDVDGVRREPAAGLVRAGDYITAVNHTEIDGKEELLDEVKRLDGEAVVLGVRRGQDQFEVQLRPVEWEPNEYRLGIWVRDNVQGLGTITFLTEDSKFGALGHGIHDIDTNGLMEISGGKLYRTSIRNIQKGCDGNPGTMEGIIVYNDYNRIGTIEKNTEAGIYGTFQKMEGFFDEPVPVQIASKEEIVKGRATIRCFVDGEVGEYDIEITEIDKNSKEVNKGIVLRVTDPELLEKTGGIIQGMSGSPILQNGKLIGAVTHVFVRDSREGYGIFIENMLEQMK